MDTIQNAYALADRGRHEEAAELLERAGRAGNANAWLELAVWYFSAQYVGRDLSRALSCFGEAARLGHPQAQQLHLNLLAAGVGGPADWQTAMTALRQLAEREESAKRQVQLLASMDLDPDGNPSSAPQGRTLSQSPHVVQFDQFLTSEECSYLVERAAPTLAPSVVVDPNSGRTIPHPVRTSENTAFPWLDEDPVIHAINRRIARISDTDVRSGEPLQVLRYRPGQEYRPHHDALPGMGNQRTVTVLVYLNHGYSGGETEFLKTGLRVAGRTGDALLFRNADDQGRPDPAAVHAGRPVTAGEKLLATRWIHQRPFGPL